MVTPIYPATGSSGSSNEAGFFLIPKSGGAEPYTAQSKKTISLVNSSQDVTKSSGVLTITGPDNYYRDITISGTGSINFTGTNPILRCRNLTITNANGITNTASTGPGFGNGFNILADNGVGQNRQVIQITASSVIDIRDNNTLTGSTGANGTVGNPGTAGSNGGTGPALYIKASQLVLATGKTVIVKGGNGGNGGAGTAGLTSAGGDGGKGGNAGYIEIDVATNSILGTFVSKIGTGGAGGAGGTRVDVNPGGNGGPGGPGDTGGAGGAGGGSGASVPGGNGGAGGNGYTTGGAGGPGGNTSTIGQGGAGGPGGEGRITGGAGGVGGNTGAGGTNGNGGAGGDAFTTPGTGGLKGTGGTGGTNGANGDSSPELDFNTIAYGILASSVNKDNYFLEVN